jgi:hypothetical protein
MVKRLNCLQNPMEMSIHQISRRYGVLKTTGDSGKNAVRGISHISAKTALAHAFILQEH